MRRRRRQRKDWRTRSGPAWRVQQVGVGTSIGGPLSAVGALLLLTATSAGGTALWVGGGALLVAGIVAAASGRTL